MYLLGHKSVGNGIDVSHFDKNVSLGLFYVHFFFLTENISVSRKDELFSSSEVCLLRNITVVSRIPLTFFFVSSNSFLSY